jgi:GDPmannose 4,6-dehydratase
MAKRALITGISGQDGSFLAELLLEKGYKVFGLKRRTSTSVLSLRRIQHILDDIELIDGDLADYGSLVEAIVQSQPDEVYNLAAQSFVKSSFAQPELTGDTTGLSVCRLLEAIFQNKKDARFYQASSSEIFGNSPPPQKEDSLFHPRSPYGCAKLYAYWMTRGYRERPENHKLFTCNGLLFNHETVTSNTPIIYKNKDGKIDIASIGQVAREHSQLTETQKKYQESEITSPLDKSYLCVLLSS